MLQLDADDEEGASQLHTTGGSHYATLQVGTPPQPQSVIVDTGSALMAFACVPGCDASCGTHTFPFFDLGQSTSARVLSCGDCSTQCLEGKCLVSQHYSEGSSWTAFSVEDRVGLGEGEGGVSVPFVFGCQTKLTGLFVPQEENGIMGMSHGPENFVAQLKAAGKISRATFALCFHDDEADGGRIALGGNGGDTYAFARLVPSPNGWFLVELVGMALGSQSLLGNNASSLATRRPRHALLDSGTTDTYLLRSDAPVFAARFRESTGGLEYRPGETYRMSLYDVLLLPTLEFRFSGLKDKQDEKEEERVRMAMPPLAYMERQEDDEDVWVPRLYFTEESLTILGSNAMWGHDVLFDLEEDRVGFQSVASCAFKKEQARRTCAEQCAGVVDSAVCGMDGETYASGCDAACVLGGRDEGDETLLWTDGPCPALVGEAEGQCRSVLFSRAPGCTAMARALLRPEAAAFLPSTLCANPCYDAAMLACQHVGADVLTLLPVEFCAQNAAGRYCGEEAQKFAFLGDGLSCQTLQGLGCCFHHIPTTQLPDCAPFVALPCPLRQSSLGRWDKVQGHSFSSLSNWWDGLDSIDLVVLSGVGVLSVLLLALGQRWAGTIRRRNRPVPVTSHEELERLTAAAVV